MNRTPFDQQDYDFSNYASRIAERTIYGQFLRQRYGERRLYNWYLEDTGMTDMDADQGIDRLLHFTLCEQDGCSLAIEPLRTFAVQERFRRAKYSHFRELTATDSNDKTGATGDFHKLQAHLYVYGYLRDDLQWEEAIVVSVPRLKALYRDKIITPTETYYQRKEQWILGFPFQDLIDNNAVLYHIKR